jgi:DNA-nicking Smr family endonuclease
MARKKKRKKPRGATAPTPELTGLARLLVEMPVEVLDLHGMTAEGAERRLGFFFDRHRVTSAGGVVHVITGKGAGSVGEAVLPGLVRALLAQDFAHLVEEFGGLPGGGGFAVRIAGD